MCVCVCLFVCACVCVCMRVYVCLQVCKQLRMISILRGMGYDIHLYLQSIEENCMLHIHTCTQSGRVSVCNRKRIHHTKQFSRKLKIKATQVHV